MAQQSNDWLIYASTCPVCDSGLRRVRACTGTAPGSTNRSLHGYVICDECEAAWLAPEVSSPRFYFDSEAPTCPICHADVWGADARWADLSDVETLGWKEKCIIENKHESNETSRLLELEDMAVDLDAVPQPEATGEAALLANAREAAERLYEAATQFDSGLEDEQAEPKPGC